MRKLTVQNGFYTYCRYGQSEKLQGECYYFGDKVENCTL